MEELARFLTSEEAKWQQSQDLDTFICNNNDIATRLDSIRNDLPLPLQNSRDLRAWKTTGTYRIKSDGGFILPVKIISGEPKIIDGATTKALTVNSEPTSFKKGDIISGNLYYIAGSS